MSSRYQFLNNSEVKEFDNPREIDSEKRSLFFRSTQETKEFKKTETQIGFILLRGYFLLHNKFFSTDRFKREDIKYVCRLLSFNQEEILSDYSSRWYNDSTLRSHKVKILEEQGFKAFDESLEDLKHEANELVTRAIRPKKIFFSLVKYLVEHKIEIPNYSRISSLVMESFNAYEAGIINQINTLLDDEKRQILDEFITLPVGEGDLSPQNPYLITTLKRQSQDTTVSKIRESVESFKIIADLFKEFEHVFNDLSISDSLVNYYASWMIIVEQPQFNAITNPEKRYLYVLSFITYQYRIRQDFFVDIFLKTTQSFSNQVDRKVKEDFLSQKTAPSRHVNDAKNRIIQNIDKQETRLNKVGEILRSKEYSLDQKVKASLDIIETSLNLRDHIIKEFEMLGDSLSERLRDEMHFEKMEEGSSRLSRKLKGLLLALNFNETASAPIIYNPILAYQIRNGKIPQRPPIEFLSYSQRKYVFNQEGVLNNKELC